MSTKFTGAARVTFNQTIFPVVADNVNLGDWPTGKQIAIISSRDNADQVVNGNALQALVVAITGGTFWEQQYIYGAMDSGAGFASVIVFSNLFSGIGAGPFNIQFTLGNNLKEIVIIWI